LWLRTSKRRKKDGFGATAALRRAYAVDHAPLSVPKPQPGSLAEGCRDMVSEAEIQ